MEICVTSMVTSEAAEQPHLILLQVKLNHVPNFLPQTGCAEKFAFKFQRGSKLANSAIFGIFVGFSNITAELFIFKEKLCAIKFRSYREASFPILARSLRQFLVQLLRENRVKWSILRKSAKSLKILT